MITWTSIEDATPNDNEWVLATYFMKGKWNCWRTRIYLWGNSSRSSQRKITHWTYINPPHKD